MTTTGSEHTNMGAYKGAVLLAALGRDLAAKVLSHLPDDYVNALAQEFSRLNRIPAEGVFAVAREFEEDLERMAGAVSAGPEFARETLERAVGMERALQILGGHEQEEVKPNLATIFEKSSPMALAAAARRGRGST